MNIAVIFAGGNGTRMKTKNMPKQFLEVNGKSIIIYTLEKFQNSGVIDKIIVVCLKEWIEHLKHLLDKHNITKVVEVVPGGDCGQESIYNGLVAANNYKESDKDIVLIHDGVRPIIDDNLIKSNIEMVKKRSSAITCAECKETIFIEDNISEIKDIIDRKSCKVARAPQSFYLKEILDVHQQAIIDGNTDTIDSCTLMRLYGKKLSIVMGEQDNIKITTPQDYFIFEALLNAKKSSDIFNI